MHSSPLTRTVPSRVYSYYGDLTEALAGVVMTCQRVADACAVPLLPDPSAVAVAAVPPHAMDPNTALDLQS